MDDLLSSIIGSRLSPTSPGVPPQNPVARGIMSGLGDVSAEYNRLRGVQRQAQEDADTAIGKQIDDLGSYDPNKTLLLAMAKGLVAPSKMGGFGEGLANAASELATAAQQTNMLKDKYRQQALELEQRRNELRAGNARQEIQDMLTLSKLAEKAPLSQEMQKLVEANMATGMPAELALQTAGRQIQAEMFNKGTTNIPESGARLPNGDMAYGVKQESGMEVVRHPVTGQLMAVPIGNSAAIAATRQGMAKEAEQGATIFTGQTYGGRSGVPVPGRVIQQQFSPQQTERPTVPGISGAPTTWGGTLDQNAIDAINRISDPTERGVAMRAAMAAMQQGIQVPGPAQFGISPAEEATNKAGVEYAGERAKSFAKEAESYNDAWKSSKTQLANIAKLEQLYSNPDVAKGAAAEKVSGLKNLAASFGVDIAGLSAEQAATALSNKIALQLKNEGGENMMPGALSDSDRRYLTRMGPQLSQSPEGRKMILDNMKKLHERNVQVADMARDYEQQNGKLDNGWRKQLSSWALANPLFSAEPRTPVSADDLVKKYLKR